MLVDNNNSAHTPPVPAAAALVIHLFGPFEARVDGAPLPRLHSRKGHWLLALLCLRPGRDLERTWLAALLWPDSPPAQALANLRITLTDLRGALGTQAARLQAPTRQTLRLDLDGAEVDVVAFDTAMARADAAAESEGTQRALEAAVALYRGPLLEGCVEEWAFQERQIREQAYLGALERLAQAALGDRDAARAARYLRLAVAVDATRESAHRHLMTALAQCEDYAAATQVYRELSLLLHREQHAEPGAETRAVYERIRAEARRRAAGAERRRETGAPEAWDGGREAAGNWSTGAPKAWGTGAQRRQGAGTPRGGGAQRRQGAGSERARVRASEAPRVREAPGTVTFLFTDIEGSTQRWEQYPDRMREALGRHDAILHGGIAAGRGRVFKTVGDGCCAVFATASEAVAAALEVQRALNAEEWGAVGPLRVRMALYTAIVAERDGDFVGPPLNRVARLLAAGHGGQILVSSATRQLARDHVPEGVSLRDLGSHRLPDLPEAEHVYQLLHPALAADFPPLRSLGGPRHNLPRPLSSFIGREHQIGEVKRFLLGPAESPPDPEHRQADSLPHCPLLTLTGTGGCGKTRLALHVAAELVEEYTDGVWLAELAGLSDPALVPKTVAATLGVREEPGDESALAMLAQYLQPRSVLLVLDNCEHLIAACAALADSLLRACPGLRILATSREPLGIAGETTLRVPSLSLPTPEEWPGVNGQGSRVKS